MRPFCLLIFLITGYWLPAQVPEIILTKGLIIKQSCRVKPQNYQLSGNPNDRFQAPIKPTTTQPVITITGNNLTVDFQNAELRGTTSPTRPDEFYGLAIRVSGRHITLKNARASGYKIALLAEGSDSLTLENCDFSYNYRPRLLSTREQENEADWLSYHHNEQHEWMRYGAGIYLEGCMFATVKGCTITGGQNALLMVACSNGTVYNNHFQFNSGLGIGLYRSRRNRLMHNFLDWNVRGSSNGVYQRGQDSAGILLFEQSSNNLIAYNSATHSGDGFFLWAGQSTLDSGKGGCNDNLIFGNDFSYAPANGVEVTFSRNRIQGNLIADCTYGIWGGYSYETVIMGNLITGCGTGIAIEHGQQDTILQNLLSGDSSGIQLWTRAEQPKDWGYAQTHDIRSRDHSIDRNVFGGVRKPLKISNSQNVSVNGENLFFNFDQLLTIQQPNEKLRFLRNDIFCRANQVEPLWKEPELTAWEGVNFTHPNQRPTDMYAALQTHYGDLHEPDSLAGGILAVLPTDHPRGRQWIIMDEWGPYDFQRPIAMTETDSLTAGELVVQLVGPRGSWKLAEQQGAVRVSAETGQVPARITVERAPNNPPLLLKFEYTGDLDITTEFGERIPALRGYKFEFRK